MALITILYNIYDHNSSYTSWINFYVKMKSLLLTLCYISTVTCNILAMVHIKSLRLHHVLYRIHTEYLVVRSMLNLEVMLGGIQKSLMTSSGRKMVTWIWVQPSSRGWGLRPSCLQGFAMLKCTLAKLWFHVGCPSSNQLGRSPSQCFIPLLIKINCSQLFNKLISSNRNKCQCISKSNSQRGFSAAFPKKNSITYLSSVFFSFRHFLYTHL